jgi:hypothetical protein
MIEHGGEEELKNKCVINAMQDCSYGDQTKITTEIYFISQKCPEWLKKYTTVLQKYWSR